MSARLRYRILCIYPTLFMACFEQTKRRSPTDVYETCRISLHILTFWGMTLTCRVNVLSQTRPILKVDARASGLRFRFYRGKHVSSEQNHPKCTMRKDVTTERVAEHARSTELTAANGRRLEAWAEKRRALLPPQHPNSYCRGHQQEERTRPRHTRRLLKSGASAS